MDIFAVILIGAAMVVGTFGTVIPLLPGLPIVWAAALLYGMVEGFTTIGWVAMSAITLIGTAGLIIGTVLPHRNAAAAGVPRRSILIGVALGIVGFFVIPVVGLPLGAALGIYAAERNRLRDPAAASRATRTLLVGFGLGALVQLLAGLSMTGIWIAWVLLG